MLNKPVEVTSSSTKNSTEKNGQKALQVENIVPHNHTFGHASLYKYRITLTFVKPRDGEGQNGRLKCPLGFLVLHCWSQLLG